MPDDSNWLETTPFGMRVEQVGPASRPVRIHFHLGAGAAQRLADAVLRFNGPGDLNHQVALPPVADNAAFYELNSTITLEGARNDSIWDGDSILVWPASIELTVKYKKEAGDNSAYANDALVSGFPFVARQVDATGRSFLSAPLQTNAHGVSMFAVTSLGPVTIQAISPWEILAPPSQRDAARKREIKVRTRPWKAKILSHAAGTTTAAPFKQMVNLPGAGNGSLVRVEVGPDDINLARTNQEIKVRVTFPATNSKRQDPLPGLWILLDGSQKAPLAVPGTPGVSELKYETVVRIPHNRIPASFYVQMGLAGGDRCKVEVGVTETYEDDTLHIQNWRQIGLELLAPDPTLRQRCPAVLTDTGDGFSATLKAELTDIFTDTFIEFTYPAGVVVAQNEYTEYVKGGAAPAIANITRPASLFVDRAKFAPFNPLTGVKEVLPDAGPKVSLCSVMQRKCLRETKLGPVKPENTLTWILTDFIIERSDTAISSAHAKPLETLTDMAKVENAVVVELKGVLTVDERLPFHVFDYDPVEPIGVFGVIGIRWRAWWFKRASDAAAAFTLIGPDDPGYALQEYWTGVDFEAEADLTARQKWCDILDSQTIRVKLPRDLPTDPGNHIRITRQEAHQPVDYLIGFKVEVTFHAVECKILGNAGGGEGLLETNGGRISSRNAAEILAHEIAHNCGQTYTQHNLLPGGWGTRPAMTGMPFAALFPATAYYQGLGHKGSHCAKALVDVLRTEQADGAAKNAIAAGTFNKPSAAHKRDYFDKIQWQNHCVMWGESTPQATPRTFCATCKEYLRAVDLTDVCGAW